MEDEVSLLVVQEKARQAILEVMMVAVVTEMAVVTEVAMVVEVAAVTDLAAVTEVAVVPSKAVSILNGHTLRPIRRFAAYRPARPA